MTFYLIMLARKHTGETLTWMTQWFEDDGTQVTITSGSTDKRGNDVILLELEGDFEDTDDDFGQHLKDDGDVVDYIIYSTGEE